MRIYSEDVPYVTMAYAGPLVVLELKSFHWYELHKHQAYPVI
jgi:hypothetical protein